MRRLIVGAALLAACNRSDAPPTDRSPASATTTTEAPSVTASASAPPPSPSASAVPTPSASTSAAPAGSGVQVGGAGVAGGAVNNASEVVNSLRPELERCFDEGLAQRPDLAGSVTLVAKIGPRGEVTGVAGGTGGPLDPIVPCLKKVVGDAKFAAPNNGVGATISIPITFVRR